MIEEWKDISGYEGLYKISNLGNVWSLRNRGNLKLALKRTGYIEVQLYRDRKRRYVLVHKLVAQYFLVNPNNYPQVNHKDGNKTNNNMNNLEWCNASMNRIHAIEVLHIKTNSGTMAGRINGQCPNSKSVLQLNTRGEILKIFLSVSDITRKLGYSQGNISGCCRGERKTAYKYQWRYQ